MRNYGERKRRVLVVMTMITSKNIMHKKEKLKNPFISFMNSSMIVKKGE